LLDPNNRPGGPHLIVTAKSADKVQFFDAATLQQTGEIDMPGSTHEMVLSPDGSQVFASIYGGGIFGKNSNPDRRIAVIDLPTKSLVRTIDVGAVVAPHGVMLDVTGTLWATGELGNALLAIDVETGTVQQIDIGGSPHWLAVSHSAGKVFASCKTSDFVVAVDIQQRNVTDKIPIPHLAEGVAVTPDGETLYVCAHRKGEFYQFDARGHALCRTIAIEGAPGEARQLRRVRMSPDGRYLLVASHVDNHAAIYDASLKQIGSIATPKAPMAFGFDADGRHAYVCCHDAAVVLEFELATARVTRQFPTAAGCEFIIAYF
jgi:DNA-binding beta-propeller fold protein YncE